MVDDIDMKSADCDLPAADDAATATEVCGVDAAEPPRKKSRFSVKEFRQSIQADSTARVDALDAFVDVCKAGHGAQQYLQGGGGCLELLQLLNSNANAPTLVLEAVLQVLLHICAGAPKSRVNAFEACRYLLNTHATLLNKMLGLNSSSRERIVALRLLTAIVAFSESLAKDVLVHINFNETTVNLLSKSTGGKGGNNPRNAFVQFLTAFLVDGHYPTISLLLSKPGLLTSVITGLQYDKEDTVSCVVLALKQHVLENPAVSRTVKMHTFNTLVIRHLVNLYNWKGPAGLDANSRKAKDVQVDHYAKARVSQIAHDFLLVLCTSHKYGVIFHDHQVGLTVSGAVKSSQQSAVRRGREASQSQSQQQQQSRKPTHLNALLYTVLESLERPWNHSFASELVIEIAAACPDLVRSIWMGMKEFVEPRPTKNWLKTVQFAQALVTKLQPRCLEYCLRELSPNQFATIVQILVAPMPILKALKTAKLSFDTTAMKYEVLRLLYSSLTAIGSYLKISPQIYTHAEHVRVRTWLRDHVLAHFPKATDLVQNWSAEDATVAEDFQHRSATEVQTLVVQILGEYSSLGADLLENFTEGCNMAMMLTAADQDSDATPDELFLQFQLIKLFIKIDAIPFTVDDDGLYVTALKFLLKYYGRSRSQESQEVLRNMLSASAMFEGSEYEMDVWLRCLHVGNAYQPAVTQFFVEALRNTVARYQEYLTYIITLRSNYGEQADSTSKFKDVLDRIRSGEDLKMTVSRSAIRNNYLSPFVLGACNSLMACEKVAKTVKYYFSTVLINLLHAQSDVDIFVEVVKSFDQSEIIYESVRQYIHSWSLNETTDHVLKPTKGDKFVVAHTLTQSILAGDLSPFLELDYDDVEKQLLVEYVPGFFVTNLGRLKELTESQADQCLKLAALINGRSPNLCDNILRCSNLLIAFNPTRLSRNDHDTWTVKFVVSVAKLSQARSNIGQLIAPFQDKLLDCLVKLLKKPAKNCSTLERVCSDVLSVFPLEFAQAQMLLQKICSLDSCTCVADDNTVSPVYKIALYCFDRLLDLHESRSDPIDAETISGVTKHLVHMNKSTEEIDTGLFSVVLLRYLKTYPHLLQHVDDQLFETILMQSHYCQDNIELAMFLLKHNWNLLTVFKANSASLLSKHRKGLILPVIDLIVARQSETDESLLQELYQNFQESISKALAKPQKAGQYFELYYKSVGIVLTRYSAKNFSTYYEKVHKFDASEPFHAHLLYSIFCMDLISKSEDAKDCDKYINNSLLTFVHLLLSLLKTKSDKSAENLELISNTFIDYLNKLKNLTLNLKQTSENESFRLFCKFGLKYGITGQTYLLQLLDQFLQMIELDPEDASLLLEMTVSHSGFLSVAHGPDNKLKRCTFQMILTITRRWTESRKGDYMPVLLSSFSATNGLADVTILKILKLYESVPAQTNFYDYKPFLIGALAANYYSVRRDQKRTLWRQPKMSDVLQFLDEATVIKTVTHYPYELELDSDDPLAASTYGDADDPIRRNTYNLQFLLPLFTATLAPECAVQPYVFSRSGALSLTIAALASKSQEVRYAACFVLSRYYNHLENATNQRHSKDHQLWLQFVQRLCRGLAKIETLRVTNVVAVCWARMALILTQPTHVMYMPLAAYLTAKDALDVDAVPELYTFLNSSSVDGASHRLYILTVVRDGLRSAADFKLVAKAMMFKLILSLYHLVGEEARLGILQVLLAAVSIDVGRQVLSHSYSLLPWLLELIGRDARPSRAVIATLLSIVQKLAEHPLSSVAIDAIIDSRLTWFRNELDIVALLNCVVTVTKVSTTSLSRERFDKLAELVNDSCANYMRAFAVDLDAMDLCVMAEKSRLMCELTHCWLKRQQSEELVE